jgi:hypothetical protein
MPAEPDAQFGVPTLNESAVRMAPHRALLEGGFTLGVFTAVPGPVRGAPHPQENPPCFGPTMRVW